MNGHRPELDPTTRAELTPACMAARGHKPICDQPAEWALTGNCPTCGFTDVMLLCSDHGDALLGLNDRFQIRHANCPSTNIASFRFDGPRDPDKPGFIIAAAAI